MPVKDIGRAGMHAELTDGRPADVVVKATTVDAPIASRARAQFSGVLHFRLRYLVPRLRVPLSPLPVNPGLN